MAKCYLSFLGTNPYVACRYQMDQSISEPMRFVQEHTVSTACKDWSNKDRIVIFCTPAARMRNLVDNGHGDHQSGLSRRLTALDLKPAIRIVDIPEGHSEKQIWDIFSIVLDQLHEKDEVVFDITHAFRSIPMLAIIILNYAKIVRKIKLTGIYYGAFEALGPPKEVQEKWPDPRNRIAPVLDLTAFDRLLDWSFAVDKLVKAGDATAIRALARASVYNLLKESRGKDDAAVAVRRLGDTLERFTKVMSTCRCQDIDQAVDNLRAALTQCSLTDLVNPIKPLIGVMEKSVAPFQQDPVAAGLHAARWCARHHLTQQGITILNETLVTWCLASEGGSENITDIEARTIASQALDIAKRKRPQSQWQGKAKENPELTHRLLSVIQHNPGIEKAASILRELRNDINHGGMGPDSKHADHFEKKLGEMLKMVEPMLRS